jgi:penicillin-binding protein 1A
VDRGLGAAGARLPDARELIDYEPPLPTMVRGADGSIVHSYARERRVQLQYKDFPAQLVNAYTSAEDETFWTHGGIDYTGVIGAVFDYVSKLGSGQRAVGGSTITQQVAKNILLGNEYSLTRKAKEMILARRIESVLTKREIMELYLNEIPLGRRSFGVQAAARAYFNKDVGDLALHEMAFLAILPKAPEKYGRASGAEERSHAATSCSMSWRTTATSRPRRRRPPRRCRSDCSASRRTCARPTRAISSRKCAAS